MQMTNSQPLQISTTPAYPNLFRNWQIHTVYSYAIPPLITLCHESYYHDNSVWLVGQHDWIKHGLTVLHAYQVFIM